MRKGALLLAIIMAASAPTTVYAAKKKAAPAAKAAAADPNDNTVRFMGAIAALPGTIAKSLMTPPAPAK